MTTAGAAPSVSPSDPAANTWQAILEVLKQKINPHTFDVWFKPTRQLGAENGKLHVAVPSLLFQRRLSTVFAKDLAEAAAAIGRTSLGIEFISDEIAAPMAPAKPAAPAKQKPLEAAADLPAEAWYGPGKEWLAMVGPTTEASPNYHLASFLTAAGACLGQRIYLDHSVGRIYPNLFTVLVGKSGGARKSTSIKLGMRLANEVDSKLGVINSLDSRQGFLEHLSYVQKRQGSARPYALVHLEEFRALIDTAQMSGTSGITTALVQAYDVTHDQSTHTRKDSIEIYDASVAILAATASAWMEGLSERDLEGGLGNRICWVLGAPGAPIAFPQPPDAKRWASFTRNLKRRIRQWNPKKQTRVTLSPKVLDRWTTIYNSLFNRETSDDPLIGVLSQRMQGHCLKAALIWAALDGSDVIELQHLDAGYAWAEFLYQNLWKLFRGFGASPLAKLDQKILDDVKLAGSNGIRRTILRHKFHRVDIETFNKRLYHLEINGDIAVSHAKSFSGQTKTMVFYTGEEDEALN